MTADYLVMESALSWVAPSRKDALIRALDDAIAYAPEQIGSIVVEPSVTDGLLMVKAIVPSGNARTLAIEQPDDQLIRTIWAISSAWKVAREVGGE